MQFNLRMKSKDFIFILVALLIILPFCPLPFLISFQKNFLYNEYWWYITSFIKFSLLATLGEVIGLRIKTGNYNNPTFGIFPRAIVWGLLGLTIKLAFTVFGAGAPVFLEKQCLVHGALESMKMKDVFDAFANGMGWTRILTAFSISATLNLIYAPVMMTFHKITDTHITDNGGSIIKFFRPIKFGQIFQKINWFVQWDFVFKKTIPFFWIPAHTLTFLLPIEYRMVFAAFLGIALGLILAIASQKGK
jgi:hypothetical protein